MNNIQSKPGVYCFYNPINNKIYIGSSKNIKQRYANYKSQSKTCTVGKATGILKHVFKKYGFKNIEFKVLFYTDSYLEWEEVLIRLLNPEYNSAGMEFTKLQPNLGKKFSKEWRDKLGKSRKHSPEIKKKLTQINKSNSCKLEFVSKKINLNFNSWVEAAKYFRVNTSTLMNAYKKKKQYKKWKIKKLTSQKKKVLLQKKKEKIVFKSASECDRFLDLWRGATSNAIKNNNGVLHNLKVEYI